MEQHLSYKRVLLKETKGLEMFPPSVGLACRQVGQTEVVCGRGEDCDTPCGMLYCIYVYVQYSIDYRQYPYNKLFKFSTVGDCVRDTVSNKIASYGMSREESKKCKLWTKLL